MSSKGVMEFRDSRLAMAVRGRRGRAMWVWGAAEQGSGDVADEARVAHVANRVLACTLSPGGHRHDARQARWREILE